MANFYATSSKIGVNLNAVTTDAQFSLGDAVDGSDGTKWVYVQASGAIEAFDAVTIDENFQCYCSEIANAMDGQKLGFAQIAFADNEYGWVAVSGLGNLLVSVSSHSTINAVLYLGTVSGHLSTTASSATVAGVAIQTASSTSAVSTPEVIATYPRIGPSTSGL